MADTRLEWWIADRMNRLGNQCWSNLVGWVFFSYRDDPDLASLIPWKPISESCREDARRVGRCYCGSVAADGSVLRYGETVPTPDVAAQRCGGCHHSLPVHPPDGPCAGQDICPCMGWTPGAEGDE